MDDRGHLSERLRRLASRYETSVSRARAELLANRSLARARSASRHRLRVAVGVALGSILMVGMLGGTVLLAGSAVPGETFYPVKRATESFGFYGDPLERRLEEAIKLAERNDRERLIVAATEILTEARRRGIALPPAVSTTAGEVAAVTGSETAEGGEPAQAGSQVAEPPVDETDDPVLVIRLSAEYLLQMVRAAKQDPAAAGSLEEAVALLALALDAVEATSASSDESTTAAGSETAPATTSTTTSTTSSTTSSTSTTTTTPVSTTTSTTVGGDGGGDDGSEPGDAAGSGDGGAPRPPITLPPP